jgi:hypothetical protein
MSLPSRIFLILVKIFGFDIVLYATYFLFILPDISISIVTGMGGYAYESLLFIKVVIVYSMSHTLTYTSKMTVRVG